MGDGVLSDSKLAEAMGYIEGTAGDLAEVGVYTGNLFRRLCRYAEQRECIAYAYDSFEGFAAPGALDDAQQYPAGSMSCSIDEFTKLLSSASISHRYYELCKGFIPACFSPYDPHFAFIYIDIDHYQPTKDAILWALNHLKFGGVLGFDDVKFGWNREAAGAINEFLAITPHEVLIPEENWQLFIRLK